MKVLLLLEKCGGKRQKMIDIQPTFDFDFATNFSYWSNVELSNGRKSSQASVRVSVAVLCVLV